MSIIQGTSKAAGGGYTIENSVRLDGVGDMSRTVSSDGNLREWSWSFWVKRSGLGTNGGLGFNIGGTYTDASNRSIVRFYSSGNGTDDFYWAERSGGAWREDQWTLAQYRDPSAWYHILLVWDTDGGTTPRARRYINGVQVTDLGSSPAAAANVDSGTNKAGTFQLFDQAGFPGREFEGYCAEMHFVDGTALAPTDFGEFNTDGVWIPKQVTGITYGSNGFYLDFADSSDLGKDVSGNSNNFTSSGLATTDQMLDTPTNNYATLNSVQEVWGAAVTLSDGNLTAAGTAATVWNNITATFAVSSGKWIFASKPNDITTTGNADPFICNEAGRIARPTNPNNQTGFWTSSFQSSTSWFIYDETGGSNSYTLPVAAATGDYALVALDADNNSVWFGHYDVSANTTVWSDTSGGFTGNPATNSNGFPITGSPYYFGIVTYTGRGGTVDFGQNNLLSNVSIPTGFNYLSTANLSDPTIADPSAHFDTLIYSGDGTANRSVTGLNFNPDFVWLKRRNGAEQHLLFDNVRGDTLKISSNSTSAQFNASADFKGFTTGGFIVNAPASVYVTNDSGSTQVAWNWKANGSGSSNTDGTITSTVSADSTSGVSIIRWSGTAANGTIGHGLGIQPSLYFVKNTATTNSWLVGSTLYSNTQFLILNSTDAVDTAAAIWNSTYPTSSVINLGSNAGSNGSGTNNMICYAFAEVEGFSKIGSYTGNSSTDGPFVYTGFKPAFIMTKRTDSTGDWTMVDSERSPYNLVENAVFANLSSIEDTTGDRMDILSNGFKLRTTAQPNVGTLVYMAFAESPFKTATAR